MQKTYHLKILEGDKYGELSNVDQQFKPIVTLDPASNSAQIPKSNNGLILPYISPKPQSKRKTVLMTQRTRDKGRIQQDNQNAQLIQSNEVSIAKQQSSITSLESATEIPFIPFKIKLQEKKKQNDENKPLFVINIENQNLDVSIENQDSFDERTHSSILTPKNAKKVVTTNQFYRNSACNDIKIQGSDDFVNNQNYNQTNKGQQKVQSQRYRDPQTKLEKLKQAERMFQSTLRNQTKTIQDYNYIPTIITDEPTFQQSLINKKKQDLFSQDYSEQRKGGLKYPMALAKPQGQNQFPDINQTFQVSDFGSHDDFTPNNLSLEDLSKKWIPGFPSSKATESTTFNSDQYTETYSHQKTKENKDSHSKKIESVVLNSTNSTETTYNILMQQQKQLHDRIQQILQIQCSSASILSSDQAAALSDVQRRAASLESGSQKMSTISRKYLVPDNISYRGQNPHFADFSPQNKTVLYKQIQEQMMNNQQDLVERLNQSKQKMMTLNIFQKQFDQSKRNDKRSPISSKEQFTAPNTLQFPPPLKPIKLAQDPIQLSLANYQMKGSRNSILIQNQGGNNDLNMSKRFMRNMTNPVSNQQLKNNPKQFKNQFNLKKNTKPLLSNFTMNQTLLQNQLPPQSEQQYTKFEKFLLDIDENSNQNINQVQKEAMSAKMNENTLMNQTVGVSPTPQKNNTDFISQIQQHKMQHQQQIKVNQDQKINLNSTYYKDATPFTSYLTREFLKQNEMRERSKHQASENKEENDMNRIRDIQIQTIKDLEDCLRDYEKTENALAELHVINHMHTGPKKQVIAKHLQIYDKQVRKTNQYRKESLLKKKEPSSVMSYLHSNQPSPTPQTNMIIHHQFDAEEHYNHPINIVLRNHNFIIKMLFKNTREQQALISSPQPVIPTQPTPKTQDLGPSYLHSSTVDSQKPHLSDDFRLKQIADIAHFMHIPLPKRFTYDSKQAIREFIQSRPFITQMKLQLSQQLQDSLNKANGTYQMIKKRQQRWQQQQEQMKERVMEKRKVNDPQVYANVDHDNGGDGDKRKKEKGLKKKKKEGSKSDAPNVLSGSPLQLRVKFPETETIVDFQQRYYIGQGNNHNVVKQMIKSRYWWQQAQSEDLSDACFVWTCWKKDKHINYIKKKNSSILKQLDETKWQKLKVYSRIDNNKQLTNKKGIFFNMLDYYKRIGKNPFDVLPTTYLVSSINEPEFKKFENEYNQILQLMKDNKIKMEQELQDFYKRKQNQKNDVLQQINIQSSEDKKKEDKDEELAINAIRHKYRSAQNTWILKPGENSNRGCGIEVLQCLNEIKSQVGSVQGNGDKTMIIQKYIDYPLLINKRKFDFRVFGLVTSINSNLKGYFYEDGYIRTSSREFNLNDLSDKFVHLTNDAIQKQADDFGKFENFNKMSYQDFQKYLNANYGHLNIDIYKHIMPQIKKLITDTYKSVCFKIDPLRLNNTFEILGYDFMIDDDFKLSLIEVNTNPCLETDSPLLSRIIPELIEASFKIVLDPIFPCPDMNQRFKQFMNQLPQEIKFQLVFDETIDGPELAKIFGINWQQFRDNALGVGKDLNSDIQKEIDNTEEEITCK